MVHLYPPTEPINTLTVANSLADGINYFFTLFLTAYPIVLSLFFVITERDYSPNAVGISANNCKTTF